MHIAIIFDSMIIDNETLTAAILLVVHIRSGDDVGGVAAGDAGVVLLRAAEGRGALAVPAGGGRVVVGDAALQQHAVVGRVEGPVAAVRRPLFSPIVLLASL